MSKAKHKHEADEEEGAVRLVGIGASAGGLEALRELMESLPRSESLSYVIAQHVSPTHVSMLVHLLTPLTHLKVQDVVDNQVPEPGRVYITPPNRDVVLRKGTLRLMEPQQQIGPKPSVNHFFHSLAEELGEYAVGIILSGTGSDGAAGMRAIKAAGGITIVQDPDTARYDGMPKVAIQTGSVDLILPPKAMGSTLATLISRTRDLPAIQENSVEEDEYAQINHLVRINTAFRLSDYKSGTVRRRIARRMSITGTADLKEYIEYLRMHKEESLALRRDTFISVTAFFRDPEAFFSLERVIGNIVSNRKEKDVIRCWVPACASGEEVYTIAMLFEETLRSHKKLGHQYMIFASDLDEDAIERARLALYPVSELDGVPRTLRETYMEPVGDHCRMLKSIRNRVVFARQNVIDDPPFARLDLISCRNLLIYFNPPVQKRVLEVFHYSLNAGGYLFLGRSETVDQHSPLFTAVDNRARIYQMQEGVSHFTLPVTQVTPRLQQTRTETRRNSTTSTDVVSMRTLEELTERYAPPSLVIAEDDTVVHFRGNLKPFLNFPNGRADMYLFDLLEPPVRGELRALVYRCRRDLKSVQGASWQTEMNGKLHVVTPAVSPLDPGQRHLLLVSFLCSRTDDMRTVPSSIESEERNGVIISELEQELANTRTHLNIVVEELETSNEELQSANEELQSANEELQSTNEELQTSNEELQSTNEELLTVNEELQVKSAELEALAADLTNVKQSLTFPLMVVDKNLMITQANSACAEIIVRNTLLDHTSLSSVQWSVEIPGLINHVRKVIQDENHYQTLLMGPNDTTYKLDVMPYRKLPFGIAGAVLLFENVTAQHRAEEQLRANEQRYELAIRGTNDGLWDWDIETEQTYVSPRFKEILGFSDEEWNASEKWRERVFPDEQEAVKNALELHLKQDIPLDIEFRLRHQSGHYLWMRARGRVARDAQGNPQRMVGSFADVTVQHNALQALATSEEKFRLAMRHAAMGMAIVQPDGNFLEVNSALVQLLGYSAEELMTLNFQALTHPDDLPQSVVMLNKLLSGELQSFELEKRYVHKEGHIVWANLSVVLVRTPAGAPLYHISHVQDITLRKQAEDELKLAASVFSTTLDGILILDSEAKVMKVNPAFEQITGYDSESLIGKTPELLVADLNDTAFLRTLWEGVSLRGSWQGELKARQRQGRELILWVGISSMLDENGHVDRYITVVYDITEQKLSQDRIHYMAHYDVLTGLANRTLFSDRVGHALARAQRRNQCLALLFIDLDHFKQINDSRGHHVGDELLCLVASRLQKYTRKGDTVARLSGDEFTILIEDVVDILAVEAMAQKLLNVLAESFELKDGPAFISASIGIALYPDNGNDIDTLLTHADLAMYRSKESGRNHIHFYAEEMSEQVQERMMLGVALRQALELKSLVLHYQPVLRVDGQKCVGAEALLRWNHSTLGWVPPGKFVQIAEENGTIYALGEFVLYEACRQMKAWLDANLPLAVVTVNVSGRQIVRGDFVQTVQRILEQTGCPPQRIVLELTENFIMSESQAAIDVLHRLRDMGFGIAIDDFGTGYSSLSYLKRLPVTALKLDKSFVRDIPDDLNDVAIARVILRLGEVLCLRVVAEGVETQAQYDFLKAEGCELCQGYLYSQALPPEKFEHFFRQNQEQTRHIIIPPSPHSMN